MSERIYKISFLIGAQRGNNKSKNGKNGKTFMVFAIFAIFAFFVSYS
jgi:hypothetical protein